MIRPERDDPHGPLAPLLVLLTIVTGLVDAFSYFMLGHVFVANMTGNVVFLGFALAGAPGFIWWASIVAIVSFTVGALVGARLAQTARHHRGERLFRSAILQSVFVLASLAVVLLVPAPTCGQSYAGWPLATLIVLLAVAMGAQNGVARSLTVPDLTTTVLTLTIAGIGADSRIAGAGGSKIGRRLVSIIAMFLGALIGVLLLRFTSPVVVLASVLALLLVVLIVSARIRSSSDPWVEG